VRRQDKADKDAENKNEPGREIESLFISHDLKKSSWWIVLSLKRTNYIVPERSEAFQALFIIDKKGG
jgi:hypothetical protein